MKRIAHMMKRNERTSFPRHWLFFDVETKSGPTINKKMPQELILGWACYVEFDKAGKRKGEHWHYIENREGFWDFVFSKVRSGHKLVLSAHNVGFDLTVLKAVREMKDRGYYTRSAYLKGGVCILKYSDIPRDASNYLFKHTPEGWKVGRRHITTIEFRDTVNYFRMPLKLIGKQIGLPKIDIDLTAASPDALSIYSFRDVEIILEAITSFVAFLREHDMGYMGPTISSQALNVFRHRFMSYPVYIHNAERATDLEFDAYFGGRCEAFHIGKLPTSPTYILDFNSCYPAAMKENEFPYKFRGMLDKGNLSLVRSSLGKYQLVADCLIDTKEPIFPCKMDGKLVFPVGRFWTSLCTPEIELALKRGRLLDVGRVAFYESRPLFKLFVVEMHQMRQDFRAEGNEVYQWIIKLLTNSLYGKWSQKADIWEQVAECDPMELDFFSLWDMDTGKMIHYRKLDGKVEELKGKEASYNSFCAIAAHVTSYARVNLLNAIETAKWENVYYCDTDSLSVNGDGLENLEGFLDESRLGALKLEKTVKDYTVYGAKDYETDYTTKLKGISPNAIKNKDGSYDQLYFPSLKQTLSQSDQNTYYIGKVRKVLKREYDKGVVTSSGHVLPLLKWEPMRLSSSLLLRSSST